MSSVIARINELGKNCHEGDKASIIRAMIRIQIGEE